MQKHLYQDAVKVIRDIVKNPEHSAELKRYHYINVALSEVWLEATPTVFLITLYELREGDTILKILAVVGGNYSNYSSVYIFILSYFSSILSSSLGCARFIKQT